MADILDKAILIGMGFEKKAREMLEELQRAGKQTSDERSGGKPEAAGAPSSEGLPPRQAVENKLVEDGVVALKEFLAFVKAGKEKLEKEVTSSSGKVFEKLNVASQDDIDIVKEMARIAREKVDRLEKRVEELEARLAK